jgi:hypothetical protein
MPLGETGTALAGQSKAQVKEGMTIFVKKELPALEPGAMTYMMSKEAYLTDAGDHNMAHLLFYTPTHGQCRWGRKSAPLSRHAESTVRPGGDRRIRGSYRRLVGWNVRPGQQLTTREC